MNIKPILFAAAGAGIVLSGCHTKSVAESTSSVQVYWQAENLPVDSAGTQYYRQTFAVTGDIQDVERLCFNQFNRQMRIVDENDTLLELVPHYHAIASPRFKSTGTGDTLVFEILTRGSLASINYAPGSFHVVRSDGSVEPVECTYFDISADPKYYATATNDRMPYGEEIYERNSEISIPVETSPYDVVPSFKKIEYLEGESTVDMSNIVFKESTVGANSESYEIVVDNHTMTVYADKSQWKRLKKRLQHLYGDASVSLPNAKITDYPSLPYRGLMIDIARNYQTPQQMKRVLDLMSIYGLNVLHFHPIDDESWRIEIDGLPELTEVGSRHGYGFESGEYLPQIYSGDGNPDSKTGSANGYFTRKDYVEMLKYAKDLGITVLPEIESPGHARAAIYAMKHRAAKTGDTSLLLTEEGDTSVYTSAQSFHDNIMNPALEGPYKFMEIVADAFIDMHREAGMPLTAIHIGGDEVPYNAWSGSPAIHELMEREGLKENKEIHAYFVKRVAESMAKKGLKISGWQEIALRHSDEYNKDVVPMMYTINCWQTLPVKGQNRVADDLASSHAPIVLSNVEHFYLDMTYSYNPEERGLNWGGTTDEFSALHGYPSQLCAVPDANIVGVSGQVWAETIRNNAHQETMLLPKMLGLAERGWNPDSTYNDAGFHKIILSEMPKWEQEGYAYHLRQPGIRLVDDGNAFVVNTPYPDAVVRYTLDGSYPDETSPEVKPGQKISLNGANRVRAALWVNGHRSVTTILNKK